MKTYQQHHHYNLLVENESWLVVITMRKKNYPTNNL